MGDRARRFAWACIPLAVWLGVIAVASTDFGSSAHTDLLIPGDFSAVVRKTAHLVEYAVLGVLMARALRMLFPGFVRGVSGEAVWRMAIATLPFGVLVAAIDEFHQSWVPSRRGSGWDVLIDALGVSVGLAVMWLAWRRRTPRRPRGRPHVVLTDMDEAHAAMGADEDREREALDWAEAGIADAGAFHGGGLEEG